MFRRHALRWIIAAAALVVVLAIVLWVIAPVSVRVIHPALGPAVQAVYATGTVEPTTMLPIAPRIGARITSLEVDEGESVVKGQVLARLENQDVENALNQLIAQEEFARHDYERYAALVKNGGIARQTYDKAKTTWLAAGAAVAAAKAQAQYMVLTAPAEGLVIRRDGEIGQFIPVNQAVFWLFSHSPLRISAEVDEEDISLVKQNQKALIRADAFPGQIFYGHVQSITPKGDPVARSYRVRINMDKETPLQIGMTTETNIVIRETGSAILVPSTAVVGDHVWRVEDGRLKQVSVAAGVRGPSQTEILKGVGTNDLIVKEPGSDLKDGQRVHASVEGAQ